MLSEVAVGLGVDVQRLKQHLRKSMEDAEDAVEGRAGPIEAATFHVLGALYVAVCPSPFGALPMPVYLTATRSSCGICPGARTRVCSHLSVAQESGAPQRAHRSSAQSESRSLEMASVSKLPIPLHDCIAALRVNADVAAMALTGGTFELKAPRSCHFCSMRGLDHELQGGSTRTGVLACTTGFCKKDEGERVQVLFLHPVGLPGRSCGAHRPALHDIGRHGDVDKVIGNLCGRGHRFDDGCNALAQNGVSGDRCRCSAE